MRAVVQRLGNAIASARTPAAAGDVRTWLLAAVLVALVDVAITRTPVLWGRTVFEHTRDPARLQFAQTYQAARALYAPATEERRVLVLGNSRAAIGVRPKRLEAALAAHAPAMAARVDNLSIFGAGLGDQEVLSRHLARNDEDVIVLTIAATDLLDTAALPLSGAPSRLLDVGYRDGPVPPDDGGSRLARWTRTVFPLFRFHEFARAAIADRLGREAETAPFPDDFPDLRAVFEYRYGERAAVVEAAYVAWRARPTLAGFVAYLEQASPEHLDLVRARTRQAKLPGPDAPAVRVLRVLLDRLAARRHAMVVLLPENPLLRDDDRGEFHRQALDERVASLVGIEARMRGLAVADLRGALGAEAFLDFDHPLPELAGLEQIIAKEIVDAQGA